MKSRFILYLLIVLALLGAARIVHIRADLPYLVSYVFSPIDQTDEGWWCRNARLYARTGAWHDGTSFNPMLQSPVHAYLLAAYFKCAGVGWVKARIFSMLLCLLAMAAIACALRRHIGQRWSLATVLLLGLHPLVFFFSRIATNEITVFCLVSLITAIMIGDEGKRVFTVFLAGILFGCAVLTKTNALILGPGFLVYLLRKRPQRWKKDCVAAFIGALAVYLLVTITMPTFAGPANQMGSHYINQRLPGSFKQACSFVWGYWSFYFSIMNTVFSPILSFLALGAVASFVSSPKKRWRYWSPLDLACVVWLLTTWCAYSLVVRYARYHLIIVLPAIILALTAGARVHAKRLNLSRGLYELLFLAATFYSAFEWRRQEFTSIPPSSHYFSTRWFQYWSGFLLLLIFVLLTRVLLPHLMKVTGAKVRKVAFCLTMVFSLATVGFWLANSEFGTLEAMTNIKKHLSSPSECIAGTVADTLALELPNPVVSLSYYAMYGSLTHDLLKGRPSLLVLNVPAPTSPVKRFNESREWLRVFPKICKLRVIADLTPSIPDEGMNVYLYRFERLDNK